MHILILEDESLLALSLLNKIKGFGFEDVAYVTSIDRAQMFLSKEKVDLLILDIHLGTEKNGIDFYTSLQEDIPAIYLTAYADDITITNAISTNPLGYLIKPVQEKELFALLKLASIQHKNCSTPVCIELANEYFFDPQHDILYHNKKDMRVFGKNLELLKILIDAKGEYLPLSFLEFELYHDEPLSDSALRTLIYRLRSLLGKDMIESKRNYGIRLKPL